MNIDPRVVSCEGYHSVSVDWVITARGRERYITPLAEMGWVGGGGAKSFSCQTNLQLWWSWDFDNLSLTPKICERQNLIEGFDGS